MQFEPEKLQGGGGSGIGLFLSKGIMDLHNGRIWVQSAGVGFGSTFNIDIPVFRAGQQQLNKEPKQTQRFTQQLKKTNLGDKPGVFHDYVVSDIAVEEADSEGEPVWTPPPMLIGDGAVGSTEHKSMRSLFLSLLALEPLRDKTSETSSSSPSTPSVQRILVVDD